MILAQLQLKQLLESEIVPPTFTHRTLCQNFLSFSTSPHPIYLSLSYFPLLSFLPAFFFSTFLLSLSASSPSLSVSVNDWKEKTDDPRIKTYWQLLSEHIYQTHIHQRTQEWAHACIHSHTLTQTNTHTQVRLTVSHLMVSLEISKFCLQPNQETHRYLMLFWCQMTFSRHVFKFLNSKLLRHFTVVNFTLMPAII